MSKQLKVGSVTTIIGRQGSGKTPTVKDWVEKANMKNNIVYDPRHEYSEEDYTIFNNVDNFKKYFLSAKNSAIVVEEATGFIASYKELEMTDFLIAVEHNRNLIFLLFHSIMDAPQYILRLSRTIILLETNDDPQAVKTARNKFYPYLGKPQPYKPVYIDNYAK